MSKVSVAHVLGVGCWFVVVDGCGGNDKPKFELERVAVRTDEAVLRLDVAVQVATTVDGAHCVFCAFVFMMMMMCIVESFCSKPSSRVKRRASARQRARLREAKAASVPRSQSSVTRHAYGAWS